MSVQVLIPEMGESAGDVIILQWLKLDGEYVERDEPICVLEVDGVDVDLPAPASGVLHPLAAVTEAVEEGVAIARVDDETSAAPESEALPREAPAGAAPAVEAPAAAGESAGAAAESARRADLERLSPAVRRLVEEHDIDLGQIRGTGRRGRLIKQDVTAYLKEQEHEAREAQATTPAAPAPVESDDQRESPQPATEAVAPTPQSAAPASRSTAATPSPSPTTLTVFDEVDLGEVMSLRRRHQERFQETHGVPLGLLSFFSQACVAALQEFPEVNASLEGEDIAPHDFVNLGIAVSTERGLLVPVLRGVEHMSMATIEGEIKRLTSAAREDRLSLDELAGGTFTITDEGVSGSLLSTSVPTPPQVAILGMHVIKDRPAAIDGQVVIRPMMYVALSYERRLISGQTSASFLTRLKELLEEPMRLVLEV